MVKGPDLLRTKGILYFRGNDQRFAFQAVHMLADGDYISPWMEGVPARAGLCSLGAMSTAPNCSAASRLASSVERGKGAL